MGTVYLNGSPGRATWQVVLRGTNGLTWASASLAQALTRMAQWQPAPAEHVLLLDGAIPAHWGLPRSKDEIDAAPTDHHCLDEPRALGWHITRVGTWFTAVRDRVTVHVGVLPLLSPTNYPFHHVNPDVMVAAHDVWQAELGVAFHGVGGVSGNALLRHIVRPGPLEPRWQVDPIPGDPLETPLGLSQWRRHTEAEVLHGMDANRAYLAAMSAVHVARQPLRHTGRRPFDAKAAGWWLVTLAPWALESVMPHPAGYGRREAGYGDADVRWLTTPTLELLDQLTADGRYGGFDVLDSWTARGHRVLRGFAERLDDLWLDAASVTLRKVPMGTSADEVARLIRRAVKATYTGANGMWRNRNSMIRRADWSAAVGAEARCKGWRRAWATGNLGLDLWPVMVDVDNWYYPALGESWAPMPGMIVGARMGNVRDGGTKLVKDVTV